MTGGALDVGSIDAAGDVQLAAVGGIVAGDITTDARMFALSDNAITLGDLSIGGYTLIGSNMFEFTGTAQCRRHVRRAADVRQFRRRHRGVGTTGE